MNVEEINTDNLVKLNQQELLQLSKGELSYVDHPTKGVVGVDMENVYVNTIEMNREQTVPQQISKLTSTLSNIVGICSAKEFMSILNKTVESIYSDNSSSSS